jgi:hypothetical protein
MLSLILLAGLANMVSGCAELGVPQADTFEKKLVGAYASLTAVVKTSTYMLERKKISSAEHKRVIDQARTAQAGLAIAEQIRQTDPNGAMTRLTAITATLTALEAYLQSKEAQPQSYLDERSLSWA